MRFQARGVWILDKKGEFHFPICESVYSAKKLVEILNVLAGDLNERQWQIQTIFLVFGG